MAFKTRISVAVRSKVRLQHVCPLQPALFSRAIISEGFQRRLQFQVQTHVVRYFSSAGQVFDQIITDFGGESITEGTLVEWRKKVGDAVTKGEVIGVIETDKVTIEIKAGESGVIKDVLVKADDTIGKGALLAKIDVGASPTGTSTVTSAPSSSTSQSSLGPVIEQVVNDFGGESITEGTLMEWRKKEGEFVQKGDILCVIETDKVTIEVKAQESGTITECLIKADETVAKGAKIVKIQTGGEPYAKVEGAKPASAAPASNNSSPSRHEELTGIRATFARLAAERLGLPQAAKAAPSTPSTTAPKSTSAPKAATPAAIVVGKGRTERRVPISFVRQRVMQRLKDTQNTAALLTTFQEADLTAVLTLRSKYKELFEKTHGTSFGLLSFFAKASSLALKEVPGVNAAIDDGTSETIYKDYSDISVPIPSPRGPISCILRNVESKSVRQLEHQIAEFSLKARKDQLTVEDLGESTFGIVDSGISGGMLGTSILNPPQSAILGTNAITKRPYAVNGKVEARPIMYLSLTYDHRLVDGREAVTFLCSVRDKLEDPSRMLLDL